MPAEIAGVAIESSEIAAGGEQTQETTQETLETEQTGEEISNQGDTSQEKEGLTAKPGAKGRLNLTEIAKTKADALKAIDPALPEAVRKAAFELGGLYREFPGGLKEAVALKNTLSEYGGAESLKETAEAVGDYQRLEDQFEKGDPAFITSLADAAPDSFSHIMPAGLEKWKQVDPEMYNYVQARVLTQTLDGVRASEIIARIHNALDPEKAADFRTELAQLYNALEGFRKTGEKAPERKTNPQNEELNRREEELAKRESRAVLAPVANEGRRQLETITDREMRTGYQWDETDRDVQDAVKDRVRFEVIQVGKKDKTFNREFERLKERGDSEGLMRHVRNFQDRVTPGIVQRVARLFAVKTKAAGKAVAKPAIKPGNGAKPSERGWETIARQPTAGQIDYRAMGRNADDMILANKAILKDGRKVQWA